MYQDAAGCMCLPVYAEYLLKVLLIHPVHTPTQIISLPLPEAAQHLAPARRATPPPRHVYSPSKIYCGSFRTAFLESNHQFGWLCSQVVYIRSYTQSIHTHVQFCVRLQLFCIFYHSCSLPGRSVNSKLLACITALPATPRGRTFVLKH